MLEAMDLFFERAIRSVADRQFVSEVVRNCPACQEGNMVLRKKPDGKFMVGCLNFPRCRNAIWLPNTLLEASVATEFCTRCGPENVHRIHFKFKQGEIPPQYSSEFTGCVGGCDAILKELMEISEIGIRGPSGGSQAGNRGGNIGQHNTTLDMRGTSRQDCRRSSTHNPTSWRGSLQTRPPRSNQAMRGRMNAGRTSTTRRAEVGRQAAFVRATGEAVSNNSCFVCGETSHWANNCPNRNS